MADVQPFRGLRFASSSVSDLGAVLSPPYDVIDAEDDRRLRDRHPLNVVRIELTTASVAGGPEGRYDDAARMLRAWRDEGALLREEVSAYYLHAATFAHPGGEATRREIIAAVRLEPWDRGIVLPHERTFPRAKADRLRLLEATETNISPLLVFFQRDADRPEGDRDAVDAAWVWAEGREADASGVDSEGVGHQLWVLNDPALIDMLRSFFASRPIFIADGHHRYETALNHLDDVRQRNGGDLPDDHPARFVMMHLIAEDDRGLVILPLHRLIKGVGEVETRAVIDSLRGEFDVDLRPATTDADVAAVLNDLRAGGTEHQTVALVLPGGREIALLSRTADRPLPASIPSDRDVSWRTLDVVLIEATIVEPLLKEAGLHAEDSLEYTRDAHDAVERVRRAEADVAVLVNPTRVDQVAAVALAGERMPEKSTFFVPKAPTGLVLRPLE